MSAALALSDVSKSFGRKAARTLIVDRISLDVRADEFVALLGPSGCGKSTILNIVAGLVESDGGAVAVGARIVDAPGPDRGVVFQNYALLPWMTVRENLEFALESALGMRDRAQLRVTVDAMLALVHLEHAADKRPAALSGGMKQRVGFARALLIQPQVILLDEPFGALDALTRAHLQDEILDLWQHRPMTALMVTHDIDEALLLADRVAIMSRGPGARIVRVLDVPFERPRTRADLMESPAFNHLRAELLAQLTKDVEALDAQLVS